MVSVFPAICPSRTRPSSLTSSGSSLLGSLENFLKPAKMPDT
jgi:hypothetical protein